MEAKSKPKSTPAQIKAMKKYRENNLEKVRAMKRAYYHKNKEKIKKKKREKYVHKNKEKIKNNEESRNFGILKRKLKAVHDTDEPFGEWKIFQGNFDKTNKPLKNGSPMKLINKITDGVCKHCLCGHRTGKLQKLVTTSASASDKDNTLDKVADQAFEENKKMINESAKNSLTASYDESSLLPMVRDDGMEYILVGKSCAKYFNMSKKQISEAFKKNKKKINLLIKKTKHSTQSEVPLILSVKENHKTLLFGKYKGLRIDDIYHKKGGDMYLEWIERNCDMSDKTREYILDVLFENI